MRIRICGVVAAASIALISAACESGQPPVAATNAPRATSAPIAAPTPVPTQRAGLPSFTPQTLLTAAAKPTGPTPDPTLLLPALPASVDAVVSAVAEGANQKEWPKQPDLSVDPTTRDLCVYGQNPFTKQNCEFGAATGERKVAILGDSHAAQWSPGLGLAARQRGIQLRLYSLGSCPAANVSVWSDERKRRYTECDDARKGFLEKIGEWRPNLVLISNAGFGYQLERNGRPTTEGLDQAWADGMASTITQLRASAGQVAIIGDSPRGTQGTLDPESCLSSHRNDVQFCNRPRGADAVPEARNRLDQSVAEKQGAHYVDVTAWFCTEETCPAVIAGLNSHSDGGHIGLAYGLWLREILAQAVGL